MPARGLPPGVRPGSPGMSDRRSATPTEPVRGAHPACGPPAGCPWCGARHPSGPSAGSTLARRTAGRSAASAVPQPSTAARAASARHERWLLARDPPQRFGGPEAALVRCNGLFGGMPRLAVVGLLSKCPPALDGRLTSMRQVGCISAHVPTFTDSGVWYAAPTCPTSGFGE